jgi:hypothetical protein
MSDRVFRGENSPQYIAITHIPREISTMLLDKDRRILFNLLGHLYADFVEETMIIKLPSTVHDASFITFTQYFERKLVQLGLPFGELVAIGSGWRSPRRGKELDESWYPRSRPFLNPPSFVIEIGHSESRAQLWIDADFWLTQTNGRTKLVLLINLHPDKSLALERWEALPNPRPARQAARAASRREFIPNKVQDLTIDSQGNVQGAPLYLPCESTCSQGL